MMDGEPLGVAPGPSSDWAHGRGVMALDRPRVMAIVNVTPDSFFDGGRLHDGHAPALDAALEHARRCVTQGADLLDIGGESTRPGAEPVPEAEEARRVVPLIAALHADAALREVPISVDTRRADVAAQALAAGASIANDISGLADLRMIAVVAEANAGLVIGHLRGRPQTMQTQVAFDDVVREVTDELVARVDAAVAGGIERDRILVDPGIGFGKTAQQSAALVAASEALREATGCAVLIGASRKSFLGVIATDTPAAEQRLPGSLAAAIMAVQHGASVLRVHDVRETVQAVSVARGIRSAFEQLSGPNAAAGEARA
ncbi:MAG: dihydropteroate synthase [Myxococcota bacterium]